MEWLGKEWGGPRRKLRFLLRLQRMNMNLLLAMLSKDCKVLRCYLEKIGKGVYDLKIQKSVSDG